MLFRAVQPVPVGDRALHRLLRFGPLRWAPARRVCERPGVDHVYHLLQLVIHSPAAMHSNNGCLWGASDRGAMV
jgi:hypothetical protein